MRRRYARCLIQIGDPASAVVFGEALRQAAAAKPGERFTRADRKDLLSLLCRPLTGAIRADHMIALAAALSAAGAAGETETACSLTALVGFNLVHETRCDWRGYLRKPETADDGLKPHRDQLRQAVQLAERLIRERDKQVNELMNRRPGDD